LLSILHPDLEFRGLTPRKFWEADTAKEFVDDILFGHWFEASDHVEGIEAIEVSTLPESNRVGYRLRVTNPDGAFVVEQQAYYEERDGRIGWMRVLCSGFRPAPRDRRPPAAGVMPRPGGRSDGPSGSLAGRRAPSPGYARFPGAGRVPAI